jgi:hypothetical protein
VLSRTRQETEAQWDNRDGVFRGLVLTERGGVACGEIRYYFGTTKGEISGERPCKRRSEKHLEFLPFLLEGRCSIQLSYGRLINSKTFAAPQPPFVPFLPHSARTVPKPSTSNVLSPGKSGISLASLLSLSASRCICSFIPEYFLETCESP